MYDSELPVRCRNISGTLFKSRLGSGEAPVPSRPHSAHVWARPVPSRPHTRVDRAGADVAHSPGH